MNVNSQESTYVEINTPELKFRLIAFAVVPLVVLAVYFNFYWISLFLVIDASSRVFVKEQYSLLSLFASYLIWVLELNPQRKLGVKQMKYSDMLVSIFSLILFIVQLCTELLWAAVIGGLLIAINLIEGCFMKPVGYIIYKRLLTYFIAKESKNN